MRKTFSILDQYGGVTQQFEGHRITIKDNDCIGIFDSDPKLGELGEYLKAVHRLAPGTTICHTEEVNG